MMSAILLNWKRPHNIPRIVRHLNETGLFDDIVIWDNSGELKPIDGTKLINADKNYGTYGRRLAAKHCKNELCYTQDDDYLVNNIPEILSAHLKQPDCIAAALSKGHYNVEANKKPYLQIGWGAVQKRGWLIDAVKPYIACYGVDDLLLSKFDRVYSVLHARHNPLVSQFTRLKGTDGKDSDRDKHSLWLQRGHYQLRDEAVARAVAIRDSLAGRAVG